LEDGECVCKFNHEVTVLKNKNDDTKSDVKIATTYVKIEKDLMDKKDFDCKELFELNHENNDANFDDEFDKLKCNIKDEHKNEFVFDEE